MACAAGSARTLYPPLFKLLPTLGRAYTVTNMCSPFQSELDNPDIPDPNEPDNRFIVIPSGIEFSLLCGLCEDLISATVQDITYPW